MLIRSAVLFFFAIAAVSAQQPNRPGQLNPAHLSEMPLPDRVIREITAPNPLDAAARQMGAFEQLNEIIAELSNGRAALGSSTPDEDRIMGEYRTARFEAMNTVYRGPQDDGLLPALRRFDEDPALRDEMLAKFFSPALRAQSTALSSGAMTWMQRLKRVFAIDIETCRRCGGRLRVIACIEDPALIERILRCVARPADRPEQPLPFSPRGPPSPGLR